jgi:hypothetical protein
MKALGALLALAWAGTAAAGPFTRPPEVVWGAGLEATSAALAGRCSAMTVRRVDPPFLDVIHDRQMQIDCEGFLFQGRPRHAEFVIGDDRLGMVWIMTTPEEAPALLSAMTQAYGAPDRDNARYHAFTAHGAALRLDRAEVLFYSPERARDCEPDFKPDPPQG